MAELWTVDSEYKPWQWRPPEGGCIGKRGIRLQDGYDKASGKAVYGRDIYRPGMLYGKILHSPYAHAKIKSMDTKKAEALPGVRLVLRYDDPDIVWPVCTKDFRHPLVCDTVNWYPDTSGAIVVAESEAICDRALKLLEIEWEVLPIILDPEEALKPGAPMLRPDVSPTTNLRKEYTLEEVGDVEAGFAKADKIIDVKVYIEENVWAGVEGLCTIAEWKEDFLEVWHHGQVPNTLKGQLKQYTPLSNIHMHVPWQGALFGGLCWLIESNFGCLAPIAAKRAQRPVKMLWDESEFYACEDCNGTYYFKIGFKNDGTVTAVKMDVYLAEISEGKFKLWKGTGIPNIHIHVIQPYVTRGPRQCYKDGEPHSFIQTTVFNHVAGELGMDPTQVALKNDGCRAISMADMAAIKAAQGFDPTRDSLKEILAVGKKAIDWDNKWHLPGTKILPNGKYHGIGFTWVHSWAHNAGASPIGIRMNSDGSVEILAQRPDIGIHAETADSQVVADELGMKYQDVKYSHFEECGWTSFGGGGSLGMPMSLSGLIEGARELKQKVLECATKETYTTSEHTPETPSIRKAVFPGKKPEELDIKDSSIFEKANPANKQPISAVASIWSTKALFSWHQPIIVTLLEYIMARQCYFMEVEVDPETGKCDVTKMVTVYDAGQVINLDSCEGQMYGGSYMGIGRSNSEELIYDPQTAVRLNDNLIGYAVAVMNDCSGPIDCYFVETHLGYGGYGAYGIGESAGATVATLTGPAIYNAIGKWVDYYPTTPNRVLKALGKI